MSVLSSTHCGVADLTGQIVDVPYAITANMLIMQLQGTSLQNKCAVPGNMLLESELPNSDMHSEAQSSNVPHPGHACIHSIFHDMVHGLSHRQP